MNSRHIRPVDADAIIPLDFRSECGESLLWHPAERALYWSDIPQRRIHKLGWPQGQLVTWDLPEMAGCIARTQDGLLAACESGIFSFDTHASANAAPGLLASVEHPFPNMRFNDGRCDRQGRFWASTMMKVSSERKPVGRWYRYAGDALWASELTGFTVPNGLAFSPDGATMYIADSFSPVRTVWALDYDIDASVPSGRRVFIDFHDHQGRPDGATMDIDGCYWICATEAGCVLRFTPQGKLDCRIDLPMKSPTIAAFGGDDMRTLFVASLVRGGEEAKRNDPHAGCIVAIRTEWEGIPEPVFAPRRS